MGKKEIIVVSNSSPLIGLAKIDSLSILKSEFGKIYIPKAVWQEVVIEGKGKTGSKEVKKANWIYTKAIKDTIRKNELQTKFGLGKGEAEAIILAKETNAQLLLIDEANARDIATLITDSKVIGTVGVLAKHYCKKKQIDKLQPLIKNLKESGFFIKHKLFEYITKQINKIS